MKKEKAVNIIVDAVKRYEECLNNRRFLIIYATEKEAQYVEVQFQSNNFLHLTGVKTKLSASSFYIRCLNNRLRVEDISADISGKTEEKLMVLPYLHELMYKPCMIGDYLNSGVLLQVFIYVPFNSLNNCFTKLTNVNNV